MKLAVIGRTHLLLAAAERCLSEGHQVVLVATARAAPEYEAKEDAFEAFAERTGAQFMVDPDLNCPESVAILRRSGASVGISVNWPTLIRREACSAMQFGILNAHAGDLPRYRGNACPNWAIINGEDRIGICVHAMDADAVDAGAVYVRQWMPLDSSVYISDVYRWLGSAIPGMFVEALKRCERVDFAPEDQRRSPLRPLRCHPRRPEDGLIDWCQTAINVARLVRASSRPFAGAFTHLEGRTKVVIWRARVADLDYDLLAVPGQIIGRGGSGGVLVACGTGAIEIEEAEVEGGTLLPAANRYRFSERRVADN